MYHEDRPYIIKIDGNDFHKVGAFLDAQDLLREGKDILAATHTWRIGKTNDIRPLENVLYVGKLLFTPNIYGNPSRNEVIRWDTRGKKFKPESALTINSALRYMWDDIGWVEDTEGDNSGYHVCVPETMFDVRGLYVFG